MTDDELDKLESWAMKFPYSTRPSDLQPLFAELRRLRAAEQLAEAVDEHDRQGHPDPGIGDDDIREKLAAYRKAKGS